MSWWSFLFRFRNLETAARGPQPTRMSAVVAHDVHIEPTTVTLRRRSLMRCARLHEAMKTVQGPRLADMQAELDRRKAQLARQSITVPDDPAAIRALAGRVT